jgi:hypothetical protein
MNSQFQSLIGIQGNLDRRPLKRLLYLVFKVQIREPQLNISFPASADKRYPKINPFKPSPSNAFSVSENLTLRRIPSNLDETRNTAQNSDSRKKTPTPSRISSKIGVGKGANGNPCHLCMGRVYSHLGATEKIVVKPAPTQSPLTLPSTGDFIL